MFSSMTSCAETLPTTSETSAGRRLILESCSFLMACLVNLRFFLTRTSRDSG